MLIAGKLYFRVLNKHREKYLYLQSRLFRQQKIQKSATQARHQFLSNADSPRCIFRHHTVIHCTMNRASCSRPCTYGITSVMKCYVMIEAAPISSAGKVTRLVFNITIVKAVLVLECLAIHTTICCSNLTK